MRPTCWVEVTRPVARPCSWSGTPEVTVRPYEMIVPRWHMQASDTATVASQTDRPPVPRASREAMNAPWPACEATRVRRAPRRPMTFGA